METQLKRKAFEATDFDTRIQSDLTKSNRGGLFGGWAFLEGRDVNCTSCSMAYEMRRRGYDVVAGKTSRGRTTEQMEAFFENGHYATLFELAPPGSTSNIRPTKQQIDEAVSQLAKQGEGARGLIGGYYSTGGGHSFVYEVHHGKVEFLDPQIGYRYPDPYFVLEYMPTVQAMRTDNLRVTNAAAEALSNNTVASAILERPKNRYVYAAGLGITTVKQIKTLRNKKKAMNHVSSKKNKRSRS